MQKYIFIFSIALEWRNCHCKTDDLRLQSSKYNTVIS